jgi:hypothetical protein
MDIRVAQLDKLISLLPVVLIIISLDKGGNIFQRLPGEDFMGELTM